MRLVSWRKHPLLRALPMARLFMQHHSEASTSTFPRSLACLIAICSPSAIALRLRNPRFCFLGVDRGFLLSRNGQVDGAPRLTVDYGASMMARSICTHEGQYAHAAPCDLQLVLSGYLQW